MNLIPIHSFAANSGIGALGVGLKQLIIQLVTFLLALFVLKKWAFKPIVKVLNQRRKIVEDGVRLGEKMRVDEQKLEEKIEKTIHVARKQADQIINDANQTVRQMVAQAETDARVKADQILAETRTKTKQEMEFARRKLEGEMAGLVAQATSAVIDEKVDSKKDAGLIERALASARRAL
jgi:F-type H+-transporting ATPase subunit b